MSLLDWCVLVGVLFAIAAYGSWKSRGSATLDAYLRADNEIHWKAIGLSIMATQASAITFLSTPGQAFADGMRYIQFYFGLPLAMIVLSMTAVPQYVRMKVYTAYEFLERRFDLRVRLFAASLFLLQRGLAAGLNIVAPAIVLSSVLGISLNMTTLLMGGIVIVYTAAGGSKAVAQTQKLQMAVMLGGMLSALLYTIWLLPADISFHKSLQVAGALDRLTIVDFSWDVHQRYTFWSGMTGGFFLALSYFGTDQSQVQRYISGASLTESRLGLLFNAFLKVPMQFVILLCGVMVFVFYQFNPEPLSFAPAQLEQAAHGGFSGQLKELQGRYQTLFEEKRDALRRMLAARTEQEREQFKQEARVRAAEAKEVKAEAAGMFEKAGGKSGPDTDFVFIRFILAQLPRGFIGLMIAMIFCGGMSTASAELNSLGTTTAMDFYARIYRPNGDEAEYVRIAKMATFAWGAAAMLFALTVPLSDNLIQAINIIGSLFYGTLLGIFVLALGRSKVRPGAVFAAGIVAEAGVIALHFSGLVGFLWYNVIGCLLVLCLALVFEAVEGRGKRKDEG
jgi:Na+/proline symporter